MTEPPYDDSLEDDGPLEADPLPDAAEGDALAQAGYTDDADPFGYTEPAASSGLSDPPAGYLEHDVICRGCEYNLRGQRPDGACPECGLAVADSLVTDGLAFADPRWLDCLIRGANRLSIGMVVLIVLSIVGVGVMVVFMFASMSGSPGGGTSAPPAASPVVGMLYGLFIGLISLGVLGQGFWLITTPEPGREHQAAVSRQLARWLVPGAIVIGLFNTLLTGLTPVGMQIILILLNVVIQLAYAVGFVALMFYLPPLARRTLNTGLERQTHIIKWGLAITMILMIPATVGMAAIAPTPGSAASPVPGVGYMLLMLSTCLVSVAFLGLFIWWLVLMFMYRAAFRRAAAR